MFFEILLLSVIAVTAWVSPMVFRRSAPGQRTYAWLLIGDLVLAIVAFTARRGGADPRTADLLGVIAIGAAVCLVMVPPILRDVARRALARDRLRLAALLIDLRELLQPGMGARAERELVDSIMAVRSGRVDEAVAVLRETRASADNPLARRQLDERIVLTYLSARRWEDAIGHYEATLGAIPGPLSPQLLVEMIRAYCEAGRLDGAADLVRRLEDSPVAEEPVLAFFVNRARLVFLAFVGRTAAVETLIGARGALGMLPDASRHFWSGVARLNAGDPSGARNALEQALRHAGRDRRAREVTERALESLEQTGGAGPRAVPPPVAELADLVAGRALAAKAPPQATGPRLTGVGLRAIPVTAGLIAANLAVAVLMMALYGSTADLGGLVRFGANVKSAVAVGEWWRLPASTFLHIGLLHLVLNMYGLWIVGRLVEQMTGSLRCFAIYMVAGLGGAFASYYVGGPETSAGASGAVFGLLGALLVELGVHRRAYPQRWRSALFGNLVFLTLANIAIGFLYPAIDQSAHLGGLVAGALATLLLSRKSRLGETAPIRVVAALLAVIGAASVGYAAAGVAATDFGDTLARYPTAQRTMGGLEVTVPAHWQAVAREREYGDPSLRVMLGLLRLEGVAVDEAVAEILAREEKELLHEEGPHTRRALDRRLALVEPWTSRELAINIDSMGGEQRFRVAVFGRRAGGEAWVGWIYFPEALADDLAPIAAEMLQSIRVP
jgi:membrane associated rhomboid family serine protease